MADSLVSTTANEFSRGLIQSSITYEGNVVRFKEIYEYAYFE